MTCVWIRVFSKELASDGIPVNTDARGYVEKMNNAVSKEEHGFAIGKSSMKKATQPEETAKGISFLGRDIW